MALVAALATGCLDEDVGPAGGECGDSRAYTPYTASWHPSGDVADLPWRASTDSYPDGHERFEGYALPSLIECGSDKRRRSHIDVTAGCLHARSIAGSYSRGEVEPTAGGAFRALALGNVDGRAVKWFAQRTQYRFFYDAVTDGELQGFKVFARYRTEDDLYVASWRLDGIVQIQRKRCGSYHTLARIEGFPPPSPGTWHRVRFDAIDDDLAFHIDGELVLEARSPTFSWGTVGIRIDGVAGVYLDDWHVF